VLGGKADAQLVRTGCERAEIIAGFDLGACPEARDWLAGQDLDGGAGDECLVRRLLMRQGRSRAYINGHPATGAKLQGLGERLVDIHGQHTHQSLLRAAHQRDLLDDYGGTGALAAKVADRYRAYRAHDQRLGRLQAESADRTARLELLRYQVEELADPGLDAAEIRDLDQEQKWLANLGELQGTTGRLLQRLYEGEPSLHTELSHAGADLETLSGLDEHLSATRELVWWKVPPSRSRKQQPTYAAIWTNWTWTQGFWSRWSGASSRSAIWLASIEYPRTGSRDPPGHARRAGRPGTRRHGLRNPGRGARPGARGISRRRRTAQRRPLPDRPAALRDSHQGHAVVRDGGGGRFAVEVTRVQPEAATAQGLDRVEFLASANPGQPMQPLAKVASGGELSRISLGLQIATAECGAVPTLVFDEVDVGIGGGVAEIVGSLLRTLGAGRARSSASPTCPR